MNLSLPVESMVSGAAAVEFDSFSASPLPVIATNMEVTAPSAKREYYGSCSVQGRKGCLNPLQKQPVSQYCNFHMACDWISLKGFSATFCGTVQVGLLKAPLSLVLIFHQNNMAGVKKEKPSGKHLTMVIFYLYFQFLCTITNFPTGEAGHQ